MRKIKVGIGGNGTVNTIPKFSTSTNITDSSITDDGSTVSITSGTLNIGGNILKNRKDLF